MTNGIMPKLEYLNPPKYDQYPKYRDYLRKVTDFSCAYCTISESESPGATFNIDHFRPQKEFPSLEASCENLRYTCPRCNSYKRSRWIQRTAGCIRDCKTCTTQDFLSKEAPCNESTTDLHTGMLKTMYEMVTTLAEQTVLMIDEEIHKLNILMEKHSGSDEE